MVKKIIHIFRARGVAGVTRAILLRLQKVLARRAKSFQSCESLFVGKTGIEVGGPSQVFAKNGIFPVYPIVGHLDNCNFGDTTVWEGKIKQGPTFQFARNKPIGRQYIAEATAMECIASNTYDFVLSSHVLEHTANPIHALSEWMRVLKKHGTLVLLLPNKDKTFDHRRTVTTLEHLIADFKAGTTEGDFTHLPEILALHDLKRDPEAGNMAAFQARSMRNFENRCLHHHVFDTALAVSLVEYMGMQIQAAGEAPPFHILVVAQKVIEGWPPEVRPSSLLGVCLG